MGSRKKPSTTESAAKSWSASHAQHAREQARTVRAVQKDAEERRSRRKESLERQKQEKPMQTGPRKEPEPAMPAQHFDKPGLEAGFELRPEYDAPDYRGSGKLQGKTALITGGDSGIGRAVAVLFDREGANVAIVYLDEEEDAEETRRAVEGEGQQCIRLPGDVTDSTFCNDAIDFTVTRFGQLDILVNNAAFQQSQRHSRISPINSSS